MNNIFVLFLSLILASACSWQPISRVPQNKANTGESCSRLILDFDPEYLNNPHKYQFRDPASFHRFKSSLQNLNIDKERFFKLVKDPAHGNIIDQKSIAEAEVMIIAEQRSLIKGPVSRGPAEIDFYDGDGNPWDIKSPVSPLSQEHWEFNKEKVIQSIRHQLDVYFAKRDSDESKEVSVLLDFRRTKLRDRQQIQSWITKNLSQEQKRRIIHIN